jgi:hypothetical protein
MAPRKKLCTGDCYCMLFMRVMRVGEPRNIHWPVGVRHRHKHIVGHCLATTMILKIENINVNL